MCFKEKSMSSILVISLAWLRIKLNNPYPAVYKPTHILNFQAIKYVHRSLWWKSIVWFFLNGYLIFRQKYHNNEKYLKKNSWVYG